MSIIENSDQHDLDLREYSPLTFAFLGDSVYELLVREYLVSEGNRPLKKLNASKIEFVRCEYQAKAAERLFELFTDEEKTVFMRGRNAHVGHVPKNSSVSDYHAATALESVFGYLYLAKQTQRIDELFSLIVNDENKSEGADESFT